MDLLLIFKLMQGTGAISKIHTIPKNPNHLSNIYSERRASKNSEVQISLSFFWDTLMCCAKLSIPNVFLYISTGTDLEVWLVKYLHLMLFYWHRYIFLFHVFIMDKIYLEIYLKMLAIIFSISYSLFVILSILHSTSLSFGMVFYQILEVCMFRRWHMDFPDMGYFFWFDIYMTCLHCGNRQ